VPRVFPPRWRIFRALAGDGNSVSGSDHATSYGSRFRTSWFFFPCFLRPPPFRAFFKISPHLFSLLLPYFFLDFLRRVLTGSASSLFYKCPIFPLPRICRPSPPSNVGGGGVFFRRWGGGGGVGWGGRWGGGGGVLLGVGGFFWGGVFLGVGGGWGGVGGGVLTTG